jgi:hypothetical protein
MTKTTDIIRKATHTHSDSIIVDSDVVKTWESPPFQRPLKANAKVIALAEAIKNDGGVVPGVITLGELDGKTYLLDGQHRIHAFLTSGFKEGYADLRIHRFEKMSDMGREFVNLNSRLVTLRPDDILRGLEPSMPTLQGIRKLCPFIGYGDIRKEGSSQSFLSMSLVLRSWIYSASHAAAGNNGNRSVTSMAEGLTLHDASTCSDAVNLLSKAWGHDPEVSRLWNGLNLTICFWLYRRTVLTINEVRVGKSAKRAAILSPALFEKAMMSVSANNRYMDWLVGRKNTDRDRPQTLRKLKIIMALRIEKETGKKPMLPAPEWAHGSGNLNKMSDLHA